MAGRDRWAAWLLELRDGGDPQVAESQRPALERMRDGVLAGAAIQPHDVVLDLGTGTGLVGFGALDRLGSAGRVIFTDISQPLLEECRRTAAELGVTDRCEFMAAAADRLPLLDASVDVVTARSVLIYLDDKRPAFAEAHRVLRPGGRLSIFEPINRFGHPEPADRFLGFDVAAVQPLAAKLKAAAVPPDQHPLTNFDERDLFRYAEQAGFAAITMTHTVELAPWALATTDWAVLMSMAPNPLDPTIGEQLEAGLTAAERAEFEAHLRPLVEGGAPREGRSASVYLTATRSG